MPPKDKKSAYNIEYASANTKQVKFSFSLKYDADILAKLDSVPNKQGYIKALIRADIAQNPVGAKGAESGPHPHYEVIPVRGGAIIRRIGAESGAYFAGFDQYECLTWADVAADAHIYDELEHADLTANDLEAMGEID